MLSEAHPIEGAEFEASEHASDVSCPKLLCLYFRRKKRESLP